MSTAPPSTVKDLCLFINEYLAEKGVFFEYSKSNEFAQNELLEFNSNMKIFSAYLEKLPESEVLQTLSLKIYNSFQDFYEAPLKFKNVLFDNISLSIKEKIKEEKKYFYFGFKYGNMEATVKYILSGGKADSMSGDLAEFLKKYPDNLDELIMRYKESIPDNEIGSDLVVNPYISFMPDKQIKPVLVDNSHVNLQVYGMTFPKLSNISIDDNNEQNPLMIEILPKPVGFVQPSEMNYPLGPGYTGDIYITVKTPQASNSLSIEYHKFNIREWKAKFFDHYHSSVQIKFLNSQNGPIYIKNLDTIHDEFRVDRIEYEDNSDAYKQVGTEVVLIIMEFELIFKDVSTGIFESFKAKLTNKGKSQLIILEKQLLAYSNAFRSSEVFYAPFTSLVQSSGYGKTKLCVELLRKYPGFYLVFRKIGETGIPHQPDWIDNMFKFVCDAPFDNIAKICVFTQVEAIKYSPTRFLLVLQKMIEKYIDLLNAEFDKVSAENPGASYSTKRTCAIENISKLIIHDPKATSSMNSFQVDFNRLIYENTTIQEVIDKIIGYLNPKFDDLLMEKSNSSFPFFLFLDEASNLNDFKGKDGVPGINIIRRGLHLLNYNTRLLVVAIGTNSDVLDFFPSVRDDSLREIKRKTLLPPFILSRNWDIFSEYTQLEINENTLLNASMFNVLVSMGRPLWSSSALDSVVSLAEAKLRNGNHFKTSSIFARLMIRASHEINMSPVLSRALIRSYMASASYVSANGENLKISYPSEPVLAMAARNMLKQKKSRLVAFFTLQIFLQGHAIDTGRIMETIFEHMTLFAVDDADPVKIAPQDDDLDKFGKDVFLEESMEFVTRDLKGFELNIRNENVNPKAMLVDQVGEAKKQELEQKFSDLSLHSSTTSPRTLPLDSNGPKLADILKCKEHLLKLNLEDYGSSENLESGSSNKNYRIVQVRSFLKKLVGMNEYKEIEPFVSVKILDGYVNVTHFINLKRLKKSEYLGLWGKIGTDDTGRTIIDRALLQYGLLRQCGFVMPPGYFGIDYIVPILLKTESSNSHPIYSYIAVQSKTSDCDIIETIKKMTPSIHFKVFGQNSLQDLEEIQKNSLVIVKQHHGSVPEKFYESRAFYRIKGKDFVDRTTLKGKIAESLPEELEVLENIQKKNFKSFDDLLQNLVIENEIVIKSSKRPYSEIISEGKGKEKEKEKEKDDDTTSCIPAPNLTISKVITKTLSVHRMSWSKDHANPYSSLTGIIIHDISVMNSLLSKETFEIIEDIINFSSSPFDNVDELMHGLVQDHVLRGMACPYPSLNEYVRFFRSQDPLEYDLESTHFSNFDSSTIEEVVKEASKQVIEQSFYASDKKSKHLL